MKDIAKILVALGCGCISIAFYFLMYSFFWWVMYKLSTTIWGK